MSLEIKRLHLPELPPGQAADRPSWDASIKRVRSMTPARVHFCHHTDVVHD